MQQSSTDLRPAPTIDESTLPEISPQEELLALIAKADEWFTNLQTLKSEESGNKIIHRSRQHHFQVQQTSIQLSEELGSATVPAEIIYFPTSAEIWLSRFRYPGDSSYTYSLDSWYGIHMPSCCVFGADGSIDRNRTTGPTPIDEAIDLLYKCEDALDLRLIDLAIGGTPRFQDTSLRDQLSTTRPIDYSAFSYLTGLPQNIARASVKNESSVALGTVFPFDRRDLTFFDAEGNFQAEVLPQAVPTLALLYRLFESNGFEPSFSITTIDPLGDEAVDIKDRIPGIALHVDTKAALKHIEIVPTEASPDA